MSDDREQKDLSSTTKPDGVDAPAQRSAASSAPHAELLDGLEDIDFLLEEIENKIAPLALA